MLELTVLKNRVGPILGRHPWVFSGAFKKIPDGIENGAPIKLVDENKNFLASGYFNSYSQITVRVWGYDENENVDEDFFIKRIKNAYELRKRLVASKNTDSFRVISSENDLLPGLVVDKYSDYLSVQFHNRGIEKYKKEIIAALIKVISPKGIYERSDVGNRMKEQKNINPSEADNLNENIGLLYGKVPERIKILENGYKFIVDIAGGQKTGFFLDQRDKRFALQKYCANKKVLNCFSYTGGFTVTALGGGAKKAVSVDISEAAINLAKENVALNKFDLKKCEFICEDVKKYLSLQNAGDFDVIILDPPAFIKDRHKISEGLNGYRKINEMALNILPAGGILVTASCSAHLSLNDFRFMLTKAAMHTGRTVQILETYTHGIDHPELSAFVEGEYLKCIFALVN